MRFLIEGKTPKGWEVWGEFKTLEFALKNFNSHVKLSQNSDSEYNVFDIRLTAEFSS